MGRKVGLCFSNVLVPDYQFLNCFVYNILENLEKKQVYSRVFREGQSDYSKHN